MFSRNALLLLPLALATGATLPAPLARAEAQQQRFALVIGNAAYKKGLGSLRNPVKDAELVTECLEKLGFHVQKELDLTHEQMDVAVDTFTERLRESPGSVALVYYAGHGVTWQKEQYLIPVDAHVDIPANLEHRAFSNENLIHLLEFATETSVRLVILDCCRDNPWQRGWRSISARTRSASRSSELVPTSLDQASGKAITHGTAVFFSTADGQKAADGEGLNSPFTSAFAEVLANPPSYGLSLFDAIRRTSRKVKQRLNQEPWMHFPAAMDECWLWKPGNDKYTSLSTKKPKAGRNQYKQGILDLANRPTPTPLAPTKAQPKQPSSGSSKMAKFLLARAEQQAEGREYGGAISDYEGVLKDRDVTREDRRAALVGRGDAYRLRCEPGDIALALADYNQANAGPLPVRVKTAAIDLMYLATKRGTARRGQTLTVTTSQEHNGQTWYFVKSLDGEPIKSCWVSESAFLEPPPSVAATPPRRENVAKPSTPAREPLQGSIVQPTPAPRPSNPNGWPSGSNARPPSIAQTPQPPTTRSPSLNITPQSGNPGRSSQQRSGSTLGSRLGSQLGGQLGGFNSKATPSNQAAATTTPGAANGWGRRNDMSTAPKWGGGKQGGMRGDQYSGRGNRGGRGKRGLSGH